MRELITRTIEQIDIVIEKMICDENNAYIYMVKVINLVNETFNPIIKIFMENEDQESQNWVKNCNRMFDALGTCIEKRDSIGIIDILGVEVRSTLETLRDVF